MRREYLLSELPRPLQWPCHFCCVLLDLWIQNTLLVSIPTSCPGEVPLQMPSNPVWSPVHGTLKSCLKEVDIQLALFVFYLTSPRLFPILRRATNCLPCQAKSQAEDLLHVEGEAATISGLDMCNASSIYFWANRFGGQCTWYSRGEHRP